MFMDWNSHYCKSINPPQIHLQTQLDLNKNPGRVFLLVEINKLIFEICMETVTSRISKTASKYVEVVKLDCPANKSILLLMIYTFECQNNLKFIRKVAV